MGFSRSGRLLGWPQILISDQGAEFLGQFKAKCSDLGVILRTIGARAPHQQGRTERRGALFKAVFQKAVWSCPPSDHYEWRLLLRETEAAKNKSFNRSGFSPTQDHVGRRHRPGFPWARPGDGTTSFGANGSTEGLCRDQHL